MIRASPFVDEHFLCPLLLSSGSRSDQLLVGRRERLIRSSEASVSTLKCEGGQWSQRT